MENGPSNYLVEFKMRRISYYEERFKSFLEENNPCVFINGLCRDQRRIFKLYPTVTEATNCCNMLMDRQGNILSSSNHCSLCTSTGCKSKGLSYASYLCDIAMSSLSKSAREELEWIKRGFYMEFRDTAYKFYISRESWIDKALYLSKTDKF